MTRLTDAQFAVVSAVRGRLGSAGVVLGVSGGADSMAMAAAVAWCRESAVVTGSNPLLCRW